MMSRLVGDHPQQVQRIGLIGLARQDGAKVAFGLRQSARQQVI